VLDTPVLDRLKIIMQKFRDLGCRFDEVLASSVSLKYGKTGLFTLQSIGMLDLSYKDDSILNREDLIDARQKLRELFPDYKENDKRLGEINDFVGYEEEILDIIEGVINVLER
jgi:hypothetical protein